MNAHEALATTTGSPRRQSATPGLQSPLSAPLSPQGGLIGCSPAIEALVARLAEAGRGDEPVLVTGETGAGKRLVARALHALGPRAGAPFVAADARALELRARAASTLAELCAGLATCAVGEAGGTLLVAELADLSPSGRAALWRCVERRTPSGARPPWRLVVATRLEAIRARTALDLGRLPAVVLEIPALRDRTEDLPLLAAWFAERAGARYGKRISGLRPEALDLLRSHSWPGNVRELESEIERAVLLTPDGCAIAPAALSPDLRVGAVTRRPSRLRQRCRDLERGLVRQALERNGWNVSATARELGISRVGLTKKLRVLGVERPDRRDWD